MSQASQNQSVYYSNLCPTYLYGKYVKQFPEASCSEKVESGLKQVCGKAPVAQMFYNQDQILQMQTVKSPTTFDLLENWIYNHYYVSI